MIMINIIGHPLRQSFSQKLTSVFFFCLTGLTGNDCTIMERKFIYNIIGNAKDHHPKIN